MGIAFLKELRHHIIDGARTDLSELEKLDLKLRKRGGDAIYRYLHSNIVRGRWQDHKGYPLKEKYHNNGLLVCSYSIREISKHTTYSDRVVRENLITMEELGHLRTDNRFMAKGQTVYILGKWCIVKDNDNKDIILEELYRDKVRDDYIKQKEQKPEENNFDMYNFEGLYYGDMKAYFGRP